jgi:hypothetical protein
MKINIKSFLGEIIIFFGVCLVMTGLVFAADTSSVSASVTIENISVQVADGNVSYGVMNLSSWKSTLVGELNDMQTATNNGTVEEDFNIKGQNSANWTLASTAGIDQYVHQFCNDTDLDCSNPPTSFTASSTNYQTLGTNIAVLGNEVFQLRIGTPSFSNSSAQQSVDVFIQAIAS